MSKIITFNRRHSFFTPDYTYSVLDQGKWIGEVARNEGENKWYASNKTWTGGGTFKRTFPTRWQAAAALRHMADGYSPKSYGGYVK